MSLSRVALRIDVAISTVDLLGLHLLLLSLRLLARMVVANASAWDARALRLLMVVLVELMDVQTATALVHMHIRANWALDLYRLRAVTLLSVQLAAIHRLNLHHVSTLRVHSGGVVRSGHNGASSRVEAEVCLVHELLGAFTACSEILWFGLAYCKLH